MTEEKLILRTTNKTKVYLHSVAAHACLQEHAEPQHDWTAIQLIQHVYQQDLAPFSWKLVRQEATIKVMTRQQRPTATTRNSQIRDTTM